MFRFPKGFAGWLFLAPGLSLMILWQLAPIFIAGYISVFRWHPVRGRFKGLDNYIDLIGEWGPGILFFSCLALLIAGVWLLGQPVRAMTNHFRRYLIASILATSSAASLWSRNFLENAIASFPTLEGSRPIRDFKRSTFENWRGDEVEQLALVQAASNHFGIWAIIFATLALVFVFLPWKALPKWVNQLSGAIVLVVATNGLAAAWARMIIAGDDDFMASLVNTVFYSVGTVFTQITLGLVIAFGLYRKIRGDFIFRYLIFLPYITPVVGMATVFSVIFRERTSGLANRVASLFDVGPFKWLSSEMPMMQAWFGLDWTGLAGGPTLGLISAILFGVWSYTGYNAVILLAGLTSIPKDLYEAAEIDGASRSQTFFKITLPLLSPVIFFLTLTGLIGTFQAFTHTFVLFERGAMRNESLIVASIHVFQELRSGNFSSASAMGVLLFLLILLITAAQFILAGRRLNSDL